MTWETKDELEGSTIAQAHISELTGAKVRIFLAEIAEGVSNYRSLHSLTQQVEHQYHGRFLIELVQNAHDAFQSTLPESNSNRIAIAFDASDSENGSLLVANDGEPFSPSNFEQLSQLGRSDKDPQKSIGNKGIGFRSVLEVSDCPEVYSKSCSASNSFDGYCFAFRPQVVHSLVAPIVHLANDELIPLWSITGEPLVDWSPEMRAKFRRRVQSNGTDWLIGETKFLSPYLLPVPLGSLESAAVKEFEARGFSTVIRLPLKSQKLRSYVLDHMDHLSSSTVLFLEKISTLNVRVVGIEDRTFERTSRPLEGKKAGIRVSIAEGSEARLQYDIWSQNLHVPSAPAAFRAAVSALPGRWPEIKDVRVSIAVKLGDIPEAGKFSIYLPTLVPTGSAAHVNAPFFGNMSRTEIPFEDAYNQQLLQTAGDLAFEILHSRLAGGGPTEAMAIIDLLAPFGEDQSAIARWATLMDTAASRCSTSLDKDPLVLAEKGWRALNATSLLPTTSKLTLMTENLLRRHATFDIFHPCLSSRNTQLRALAKVRYPETGAFPLPSEIAATVAAIAAELLSTGGNWNDFWRDVIVLLPSGQRDLAVHEVLLGGDSKLHSGGSVTKVFFVPRQGTPDDGDVDGSATEVPSTLQPSVAFLNEQVQVYDPNRPTVQTTVRTYLGNGLVSPFRVEAIFSGVLHELTPPLPVPIEGPHFELCQDIMRWALRLIGNIVARGRGAEATMRLLRSIPVPCQGGWYPMGTASFGEGWTETIGSTLKSYLDGLNTSVASEASRRLLLSPSNLAWGKIGIQEQQHLLRAGGVFDGLRLHEIRPEAWRSVFRASSSEFVLPTEPPPNIGKEWWSVYGKLVTSQARPYYSTPHPYVIGLLHTFPGFEDASRSPDKVRIELSELILKSLPQWAPCLAKITIAKQGGLADRLTVTSPLKHFLHESPWLAVHEGKGLTWARPADRWHVPADAIGNRVKHFAHLRALPSPMARRLDMDGELSNVLYELGMPLFSLHADTESPKLLEALTSSIGSDEVPEMNVLLGQFRDAWHRFRPTPNQPPLQHLVVRRRNKRLEAVAPTPEAPVFLPDHGTFASELEQFDLPVLTTHTNDAKDLREWFVAAYGSRVQLTSKLALVPHVNGAVWSSSSTVPFADSDLGWLIRPLLALVAFHGQLRGIHSTAFQERLESLRQLRIDWVPNVSVAVMRENDVLITSDVTAHWDFQSKTIIATEFCRKQPGELSTAFSQALGRDDLELPLRFTLRSLESADAEPEDIAAFLAGLRISTEQVQQVIEHLRGDVGHMSRLVHLLVRALSPEANAELLLEAKTEDELAAKLSSYCIPALNVLLTLRVATDSQDMYEFGRSMYRELGERVSLSHWNNCLAAIGQTPLTNRNWSTQLQAGLEEAAALIKHVIAHLIRRGNTDSFRERFSAFEQIRKSVDLGQSHWDIDFQASMGVVADLILHWNGGDNLSEAVRQSASVQELRERLLSSGVTLDVDPDEYARRNQRLVETVADQIERLRLAWLFKAAPSKLQGEWLNEADKYMAAAEGRMSNDGFTRIWSEAEVLQLLRASCAHVGLPAFWTAIEDSSNLGMLQELLQLSGEELAGAEAQLASIKSETTRRQSLVRVCGEDFDSADENLAKLWDFLRLKISDEAIANTQALDLGKVMPLAAFTAMNPKRKHDQQRQPPKKKERQSKAVDELVGLAGEVFVYRMLQQNYGSDIVSASAWVSENSRRVYKSNHADDGRGCDFAFTVNGKLLRIEVKSSAGDDEAFKLGSSEIRLAMELGTKGKRRREVFILVHVKNALSVAPTAVVLPNPYDPKFMEMFRVEEADARVRYRAKI